MRTIPFREVYNRLLRLYGRDPKKRVKGDMDVAAALVEHINQRVRVICQCWRWPEWELTEERAYRQIWNPNDQYSRTSTTDGQPDEVFFLGTGFVTGGAFGTGYGYYRVNPDEAGDPPVGTSPATPTFGPTYWLAIDPVDTFIAYDQRCRRSIGMVLGIYTQNPRVPTTSNFGGMKYMPSERGIDVRNGGNPTVFLNYKMPVPRYTMLPYVVGKVYAKGEITFDPSVGECFQALIPTSSVPSNTNFWRRIPFPESWANYVVQGAFADSLMEFDQGGNTDIQAKMVQTQYANDQADTYLQLEIDSLGAQGQKLRWDFCQTYGCWCDSLPFNGGSVSTLSDTCQDELGWIYPTTFPNPQIVLQYRSDILSIDGPILSLVSIPTNLMLSGSVIDIIIGESGDRGAQRWNLLSGPAAVGDGGQRNPLDYNALTNNKHWELVGS